MSCQDYGTFGTFVMPVDMKGRNRHTDSMADFITSEEIQKLTGKSERTIRRFIKEVQSIQPEAVRYEVREKKRRVLVKRSAVTHHYDLSQPEKTPDAGNVQINKMLEMLNNRLQKNDEMIERLQKQLETAQQQIFQQSAYIADMSNRLLPPRTEEAKNINETPVKQAETGEVIQKKQNTPPQKTTIVKQQKTRHSVKGKKKRIEPEKRGGSETKKKKPMAKTYMGVGL